MEKLELIKKIEADLLVYTDPQIVERLTYLKNKLNENPPTLAEYFTIKNRYLSNSRIGDFIKDKHYFYQKHIEGSVEQRRTDAMLIGGAVDCWLTKGRKCFEGEYIVVSRRNLKSPPLNVIELNQTQMEEITRICVNVEAQDAFKALAGHNTQQILTMPMDLGTHFVGLCGIPDWFKVDGKTAVITDLKTAERADNVVKYFYHCLDYSYFRQAAIYAILVKYNFKEVENVTFRHITVQKDSDHIYKVFTFILDAERIAMERENVLTNILPAIAQEKEFKPSNVKWSDAQIIGSLNEEI